MKTEAISIRVDPRLMKSLRAEAKRQRRSLADMCRILLEKALEDYQ